MDTVQSRQSILSENLWKAVITLALPVMATNLIQTIYNLVDTFFIGRLGTSQVASVQLSWPVNFLLLSLGAGLSIATTSMIAQHMGAGHPEKAKKVAGQVLLVNLLLSVAVAIVAIPFLGQIVHLLRVEGDLYKYTYQYLLVNFIGLPTMFLMFAYNGIKTGSGDTLSPMILNTIGVIFTIILDPILIFGLNMGVAGGAWAMVISRGIFATYAIFRMFIKPSEIQLTLEHLKPDFDLIKHIFNIAIPSSVGQSMEAFGFLVMNIFIVELGEATLTAFSIGNRVNGLILMPAMGIGAALATIVGQNLGANQLPRAKEAVKISAILSTSILTLGGIPMIIWAKPVIGFFSNDPTVVSQGTFYLILITLSIPLMGFFNVFVGTFQGAGHTLMVMCMQMGRLWGLRIPLIIILMRLMPGNPSSIWYSMILSNFLTCVFGLILYKSKRWEKKVV
jgi:putative MATE family efflux protein